MKDANTRTRRDHDIIRQSSLKAAADLTASMIPTLENKTEISDLVLKVADKFNAWVLNGEGDGKSDADREAERIREELNAQPPGRKPYIDGRSGRETTVHQSDRNSLPVTKKQYGFLIGLLKEHGIEPIYEELDALTVGQASDWISDLKNSNGGNGKARRS